MTLLIIFGIIIFFILVGKSKPQKPTPKYQTRNTTKHRDRSQPMQRNYSQTNNEDQNSKQIFMDDSIINVGTQSFKIEVSYGLESKVPYWAHSYVYSYNELNYATAAQKKFYYEYKAQFLNGEYPDLEGNTNYAFILLFDLLNEFDKHKNVAILENQLDVLGKQYPKTKSYGTDFLIKKMYSVGDTEGIERLREDHYHYSSNINYSTFEWRNKYKKILNLKKEETNILDKIWYSNNNFVGIEFCAKEIIRLYLSVIIDLRKKYVASETTIEKKFEEAADIVARKHFRFRTGSANYKYSIQNLENEFYTNIFKFCENAVRDSYGHKRKINIETYSSTPEANEAFENIILKDVNEILAIAIEKITPPDEPTELILNQLNTTRWKIKFEQITSSFRQDAVGFKEQIILLGKLNADNPSVENIFYEASKFIAKESQEIALSLYVHYIQHDLNSATFDNKQLTKTIQKSLFKNEEQLQNFEAIINEFITDRNFEKALNAVPKVYAIKRKKIQLDRSSIKEVQEQHSGTVELLNEYLKDETEEIIPTTAKINDELELKISEKSVENITSIYSSDFPFKEVHTATLEYFSKNSFSMLQVEFENFAKSKGAFKNQLIESINEMCYERLDDVLIEEDEDYYTINQDYYHKLLA